MASGRNEHTARNRPSHDIENTGEYLDGFGNKAYVYAVGNPEVGTKKHRYEKAHQKGSGFGLVTIDTNEKTYLIESFRFLIDATDGKESNQFPGWPVMIHQQENGGNNILEAKADDGFTAIFNGKDLTGWHGRPHFSPIKLAEMSEDDRKSKLDDWMADAEKHWTVENGELVNDGHGAYLVTNEDYRDYELKIDYKTVPRADSGIYLKGTPQVQIWDSTEEGKFKLGGNLGSGGLWNNSAGAAGKDPMVLADKPFGEWNSFFIRQVGARTTVILNDQTVVENAIMENFWDRKNPLFAAGPIQLQTHGGEIRWRNIFVRELSPEEAGQRIGLARKRLCLPLQRQRPEWVARSSRQLRSG